jgi:hypothetical protein
MIMGPGHDDFQGMTDDEIEQIKAEKQAKKELEVAT